MTSTVIRVLIVDDEPVARRSIRTLLEREPDMHVAGECGSGEAALRALRDGTIDIVFLDIRMPTLSGLAVAEALPANALPLVVFVTAYDEYAVPAFEVSAVDYVLKPFDDDRFRATVRRLRQRVRERRLGGLVPDMSALASVIGDVSRRAAPSSDGFAARLPVRVGNTIEFVGTADIDWIEAEDYCVRLHAGGRSYLLRDTLTRLEASLDPAQFIRVHRSATVRIQRVRQLVPLEHGDSLVVLTDGTRIRVSRTRRKKVYEVLGLD